MFKLKKQLVVCLLVCLQLTSISLYAQKTSVNATINPSQIIIGQQAIITLDVKAPKGRKIAFPVFNYRDPLIKGIEVIEMFRPDTVIDHNVMSITQRYAVTSFDSALYNIDYVAVIDLDTKDTIKSRNFGLKVISPVLSDTTLAYLELMKKGETDSINFEALQIRDIKDVQEPPFVWQDYLIYILLGLAVFLLLGAIAMGLYLFMRKKKEGYFFKPKVIPPPHVLALMALDAIKSEKLCQHGREKEFYTNLTDVLRTYIEKRFKLNAHELTSDEIIGLMRLASDSDSARLNLGQILKLADLVKFAKYKPLPDENDLSLMNAYLFINQTKIEPVAVPADDKKESISTSESPKNPNR